MLEYEIAGIDDANTVYQWANDPLARENSYNKEPINYNNHLVWFNQKINSQSSKFYIFYNEEKQKTGFVRLDLNDNLSDAIISIVVDANQRGRGYSKQMIEMACEEYLNSNLGAVITAYVFKTNLQSYKSFLNAGFVPESEKVVNEIASYILIKK
jgi:UDP-2,4-diacetamido-2,4,6-trideoxy-beta-L-altropyranose hydrolase